MKNIKNRINSQLFKAQEVELQSERVELNAKDLNKNAAKAQSEANSALGGISFEVDKLKSKINTQQKKAMSAKDNLEDSLQDFETKAKSLGFNPKDSNGYNDAKKNLEDIYEAIQYLNQIEKSLS